MIRTKGYATQDEAIEVWNTWVGQRRPVSQEDFNRVNDSVVRDYPVVDGKLSLPDGDHAFGSVTISEGGAWEHPWPRIYVEQYKKAEAGLYGEDDMVMVYKLRARWRLIERDHLELRKRVAAVIEANDRENKVLNRQLRVWNEVLAGTGFPSFTDNDLRGVELSGLTIGRTDGTVWLRRVKLDYAEIHLLRVLNANLYEASLVGVHGMGVNLSHVTAHGANFTGAFLLDCRMVGAALFSCDFSHAVVSMGLFDGADCQDADFSSALCIRASFDHVCLGEAGRRVYSDLGGAKWNVETKFSEAVFNEFLREQNPELALHLEENRDARRPVAELAEAVEIKPGLFGLAVDVVKVFSWVRKQWRRAMDRRRGN